MTTTRTRPCRILQGTALGDSMGAGYEFIPQDQVTGFTFFQGYRRHQKHTEIEPGMFTDDTMLSVVAARALLKDQGDVAADRTRQIMHALTVLEEMVTHHAAHPSVGYSSNMRAALDEGRNAKLLLEYFERGNRTDSNGSAMRSAIYGALPTVKMSLQRGHQGSLATHDGYGVEAAEAVAVASHYFFHGLGPKADLNAFLVRNLDPKWTLRWTDRVAKQNGPLALTTVCGALTAVRENDTLTGVIEAAIRMGGDTDTVAAIAGALAISCDEIVDDVPPEHWETIKPVSGLTMAMIRDLDAQLDCLSRAG